MTDDPRTPLCRELDELGVWTLQQPESDFVDRVLAERSPAPRRRGWVVAAAGVLLAGALGWWLTRSADVASGSHKARERGTVAIAERSRVVAEPNARLSWSRRDGTLVVDQVTGDAFYRIDPDDGPVLVHTPAADVTVTGTCFSVHLEETQDMPIQHKTFAAGATLAVVATVTVYEGSTVLANESGSVALDAGDSGRARTGEAPIEFVGDEEPKTSTGDPSMFALRQENRRQTAELERLRTQAERASSEPPSSESERARFSAWGPPIPEGFDHYAPTDAALAEMAECGIVAWDQPPVWADDHQPDAEYLDALDLDAEDREAFVEVFDAFRSETVAHARQAYVDLGGEPAIAEAIDPSELIGLVYGRTSLDAREEARIAMAMERAGLAEPPTGEISVGQRFLRWDADRGDAFERALAQRFGEARAQELRAARGGWPGKRTTWADLCSERK